MTRRRAWRGSVVVDRIRQLDPETDHCEIVRLGYQYDFHWDLTRADELALFRTFAVPRIARLLHGTGEFVHRTQKRYDDTVLILATLLDHGYDSPRGRAALRRMNQLHHRHAISQADHTYVLSTFVVDAMRWIERWGWRPATPQETQASVRFWQEVGLRMGIRHMPADLDEFVAVHDTFERDHFAWSPEGQAVAAATIDLIGSWVLPRRLRPLARRGVAAIADPPLRRAVGLPTPTAAEERLVDAALRTRSAALRQLPRRHRAVIRSDGGRRTYPTGYTVEQLGPPA